jgi:hypothetical protein
MYALWYVEQLLGKNHEISKNTTAVTEQRLRKQAWQQLETGIKERCFLCVMYRDIMSMTVGEMSYL